MWRPHCAACCGLLIKYASTVNLSGTGIPDSLSSMSSCFATHRSSASSLALTHERVFIEVTFSTSRNATCTVSALGLCTRYGAHRRPEIMQLTTSRIGFTDAIRGAQTLVSPQYQPLGMTALSLSNHVGCPHLVLEREVPGTHSRQNMGKWQPLHRMVPYMFKCAHRGHQ